MDALNAQSYESGRGIYFRSERDSLTKRSLRFNEDVGRPSLAKTAPQPATADITGKMDRDCWWHVCVKYVVKLCTF